MSSRTAEVVSEAPMLHETGSNCHFIHVAHVSNKNDKKVRMNQDYFVYDMLNYTVYIPFKPVLQLVWSETSGTVSIKLIKHFLGTCTYNIASESRAKEPVDDCACQVALCHDLPKSA